MVVGEEPARLFSCGQLKQFENGQLSRGFVSFSMKTATFKNTPVLTRCWLSLND